MRYLSTRFFMDPTQREGKSIVFPRRGVLPEIRHILLEKGKSKLWEIGFFEIAITSLDLE